MTAPTTLDLATAAPADFDAEYVRLAKAHQQALAARNGAIDALHIYVGDSGKTVRIGRRTVRQYQLSAAQVLTHAEAGEFTPAYHRDPGQRALERYAAACTEATALQDALEAMDAAYQARGAWPRFFLVPGGHIHKSTSCSTCNREGKATQFGWLTDMSGRTEADTVAEHGALLCTVCFPSAPVHWTNGLELAAEAKRAEQCPGSGTWDWERAAKEAGQEPRYGRRYQTCPHCSQSMSITSTGKLRAHKPAKVTQ